MRLIPYRDSSETNDIWLKRGAFSSKATTGVDAYKTAYGNDMNGFNNGKTREDVYNKVTINGLNTGTSTVVCLNMRSNSEYYLSWLVVSKSKGQCLSETVK